jgi:Cu/Zn superoxide dismutase
MFYFVLAGLSTVATSRSPWHARCSVPSTLGRARRIAVRRTLFMLSVSVWLAFAAVSAGAQPRDQPPDGAAPQGAGETGVQGELPPRFVVTDLASATEGDDAEGLIVLTQSDETLLVEAELSGLEPGPHRVVVRDTSSCDESAASAASATRAGEIRAAQRDGDATARDPEELAVPEWEIGELVVDRDGAVRYRLLTDVISLAEDAPDSVIGKVIAVKPSALANEGPQEDVLCGVVGTAS